MYNKFGCGDPEMGRLLLRSSEPVFFRYPVVFTTEKPLPTHSMVKPLIDVGGKLMFAELAIMHQFFEDGW